MIIFLKFAKFNNIKELESTSDSITMNYDDGQMTGAKISYRSDDQDPRSEMSVEAKLLEDNNDILSGYIGLGPALIRQFEDMVLRELGPQ